jgi:hypothetical protein
MKLFFRFEFSVVWEKGTLHPYTNSSETELDKCIVSKCCQFWAVKPVSSFNSLWAINKGSVPSGAPPSGISQLYCCRGKRYWPTSQVCISSSNTTTPTAIFLK